MSDYISRVEIIDTYGTERACFEPKTVTRITGHNASGKSSILRALLYIFRGGCDPTIIRKGADRSIIHVGTANGVMVKKTTAKKKRGGVRMELEIIDPSYGDVPVPAPQTYVERLSQAIAVDPGAILRIDASTAEGERKLCELLLSIMNIAFEPPEIAPVLRYRPDRNAAEMSAMAMPVPDRTLDLDGIKKLIDAVREGRKRVGVERDEAEATINQWTKLMGADDGRDYRTELETASRANADLEAAVADQVNEAKSMARVAGVQAKADHESEAAAIDRDIDARIAALNLERSNRKATAQAAFAAKQQRISESLKNELSSIEGLARTELDRLTSLVASLKEKSEAAERAKGVKSMIDDMSAKWRAADWKYERLTDVIAALDELRQKKLASLPIPDLVVEDGKVLVNGVEWHNVNTARRVEIAVQICSMRAGELSFLILDDAEHLDNITLDLLEQGVAAAGFQIIEAVISRKCTCGHHHPEDGPTVNDRCDACGCTHYQPEPLAITTFERVAA